MIYYVSISCKAFVCFILLFLLFFQLTYHHYPTNNVDLLSFFMLMLLYTFAFANVHRLSRFLYFLMFKYTLLIFVIQIPL